MRPILMEIPVPILTPRLLIRGPQPGDGAAVNAGIRESVEELKYWMPWSRGELPSVEDSEERIRKACAAWITREDMLLHAYDRVTGEFVVSTGFHRIKWQVPAFELGYWCRTSKTGQGYVTETANAMTRWAFGALGAKRVEARCSVNNSKSIAVIKRLGFEFEGKLRGEDTYVDPTEVDRDTLVYSRLSASGLPALDVKW